jgi:hypothetical protein
VIVSPTTAQLNIDRANELKSGLFGFFLSRSCMGGGPVGFVKELFLRANRMDSFSGSKVSEVYIDHVARKMMKKNSRKTGKK